MSSREEQLTKINALPPQSAARMKEKRKTRRTKKVNGRPLKAAESRSGGGRGRHREKEKDMRKNAGHEVCNGSSADERHGADVPNGFCNTHQVSRAAAYHAYDSMDCRDVVWRAARKGATDLAAVLNAHGQRRGCGINAFAAGWGLCVYGAVPSLPRVPTSRLGRRHPPPSL